MIVNLGTTLTRIGFVVRGDIIVNEGTVVAYVDTDTARVIAAPRSSAVPVLPLSSIVWAGASGMLYGIDPTGNSPGVGIITNTGSPFPAPFPGGPNYIFNSLGAFFYSAAPALGDLFVSIASKAALDQFGNSFLSGIEVQSSSGRNWQILGDNIFFNVPGNFGGSKLGGGTVLRTADSLLLASPNVLSNDVQTILELVSDVLGGVGRVQINKGLLWIADTQAATPAIPLTGFQLYADAIGKPAIIPFSGLRMQIPLRQLAVFTDNTVTQAVLTNIGSSTYQGGDGEVGSRYEFEIEGNGTQGSTAQTLQFACVFGGNTLATVTLPATFCAASGTFKFHVVAEICLHDSPGVTAKWRGKIWGIVSTNAGVNTPFVDCSTTAASLIAVDSTINETFGISCAWGSTTGAPALTNHQQHIGRAA